MAWYWYLVGFSRFLVNVAVWAIFLLHSKKNAIYPPSSGRLWSGGEGTDTLVQHKLPCSVTSVRGCCFMQFVHGISKLASSLMFFVDSAETFDSKRSSCDWRMNEWMDLTRDFPWWHKLTAYLPIQELSWDFRILIVTICLKSHSWFKSFHPPTKKKSKK